MKTKRFSALCLTIFLFVWICPAVHLIAGPAQAIPQVKQLKSNRLPLLFEENRGQVFPEVKYLAKADDYMVYLTPEGMIWKPTGDNLNDSSSSFVKMSWLGGNQKTQPVAEKVAGGSRSYFRGDMPSSWRTGVPTFHQVRYREIYPGIDLVLYGNPDQLEYDFTVSAGADSRQIRLKISGASEIKVSPDGNLILKTGSGEFRNSIPAIYQMVSEHRQPIAGRFDLDEEGIVTFEIESYNRSSSLIIDPVLVYSTYFGGGQSEVPAAVTIDSEGNFYVTGSTGSDDFPLLNPFQEEFAGGGATNGDVFVTKIDPTGSKVFFSTYIGGSGTDIGQGIALDAEGNVYVTGTTFSSDFPSTEGAFQESCTNRCPFALKLSADGSQLEYSTFVGRGGGLAVAVDTLGQAILTGETTADDFPVKNAFQEEGLGGREAFVTKLNEDGSDLVFSTYLGGSLDENLIGRSDIATDIEDNIYLTGRTVSTDFPTLNPIQASAQGADDAFVTKFTPQGGLVYSTYLGGNDEDQGYGIAADQEGHTYIVGRTRSVDFPVLNAYQSTFGGGAAIGDAFIARIDPDGGDLVFSTYLGGTGGDTANDVSLDHLGRVVVVGNGSADFPVRMPFRDFDGINNYVAKLSADGSELVYSTSIGGADEDVVVATSGTNVYVAGNIAAGTLPVLNAIQPRKNGFNDLFFTQISDQGSLYFAQFGNGDGTVSEILLTNSSDASSSSATVTFRNDDGEPLEVGLTVSGDNLSSSFREQASEVDVVVPPLGLVKITTDGIGDIVTGSVTVTYDIPLGGVIRFRLDPFGIAGVNQSELVRGFITPVRRTSINTGVALHNPQDEEVGITLRLRDRVGEVINGGLTTTTLAAFGHRAQFISELFPSAELEDFEGTLTVEVNSLNDLIVATALELGSQPGEFTTLPVTPRP